MARNYVCWKCGAGISHLPFPLGRMSKCESCKADLHVCKQCTYYDTSRANHCQEPVADPVTEKNRANFCGYFEVRENAFSKQDGGQVSAVQQDLSALFGEAVNVPNSNDADSARSELEKLFGDNGDSKNMDSEKD